MAKTINQLTQAESINVSDKLIIEQVDGTKSITINELDKRFIQDVNLEGYATKEELETKAEKVHTHDTYATTVNVNSLLEGKADTTHNHDSVYSKTNHTHEEYAIKSNTYTKEEVDGLIPEEVDLSGYETTISVDGKLASKADKSHTHNEYANVEHTHNNYAVKSDTYTKAEVDGLIPEEVDLSDYETTVSVNEKLANKSDITHNHDSVYSKTNHTHEEYAKVANTYTKGEIDSKISEIVPPEVDLSLYATKEELKSKAEKVHTHEGYETTVSVDGKLASKADKSHTHEEYETTVSVDGKLASKAEKVHTHEEYANVEHTHNNYAVKSDTYTKAEVDELIPEEVDLSSYATKVELNSKANTDHNHDSVYSTISHTHDNYAVKTDTYTKAEVDGLIEGIDIPTGGGSGSISTSLVNQAIEFNTEGVGQEEYLIKDDKTRRFKFRTNNSKYGLNMYYTTGTSDRYSVLEGICAKNETEYTNYPIFSIPITETTNGTVKFRASSMEIGDGKYVAASRSSMDMSSILGSADGGDPSDCHPIKTSAWCHPDSEWSNWLDGLTFADNSTNTGYIRLNGMWYQLMTTYFFSITKDTMEMAKKSTINEKETEILPQDYVVNNVLEVDVLRNRVAQLEKQVAELTEIIKNK